MSAVLERKPKTRRCAVVGCSERFTPTSMTHKACGPDHARLIAQAAREQKERKEQRAKARAAREDARETRARLESLKTLPQLLKEAQREFNRFIRARDGGRLCISSGRHLGAGNVGGGFDAGHYRSVGSAPHLRFHEDNCHGQSKYANQYLSGDAQNYRAGLIARIGIERVEALEANNTPHKWTRDEVREIRDRYRAKANELQKAQVLGLFIPVRCPPGVRRGSERQSSAHSGSPMATTTKTKEKGE